MPVGSQRSSGFALILILISFYTAAQSSSDQPQPLIPTECHVSGIKRQVLCGQLKVPENYEDPQGKHLDLNLTILPAVKHDQKLTPLVFLAGGPGQAATDLSSQIHHTFHEVLKNHDIILLDQRGTGQSAPLECPDVEIPDSYSDIETEADLEKVNACLQQLPKDLTQFNSENAIRDLERLRQALGYQQFNLYGGSYGSRAAQIYMRLFPASLRSVVLDSVSPIDIPIGTFAASINRSLNLVFSRCEQDPACQKTYPEITKQFNQLLISLQQHPVNVMILHPQSALPTQLVINDTKFMGIVTMALYTRMTHHLLPLVIQQTALGNYQPITGLLASTNHGMEINNALYLNIVCNEDFPRITPEQWQENQNIAINTATSSHALTQVCPIWPKYSVPPSFAQPVTAKIPTLILSGQFDPVTPPSYGEHVAQSLANSHHIIDQRAAHIVNNNRCTSDILAEFYQKLTPKHLDTDCLNERPSANFILNLNGGYQP